MLQIVDWEKHFENNRTRDLKRLDWVPVPNRMDDDGYTELLDHPNGAAHFGAWIAIVEIASRCEMRGTLSRDGARPHDAASLGRISRIPAAIFDEVIPRLLALGWVVDKGNKISEPHDDAEKSHDDAPRARGRDTRAQGMEWNGNEGNGMEGNTMPHAADAASPADAGAAPAKKEKPVKLPKDPLAAFPDLADFFLTLLDHIQGEHPRADVPLHGTGDWFKWRGAFASLASGPKGYDPTDLQTALEWVFLREQPRNEWPGWKVNVRSIPALKIADKIDGRRKIDKIMDQWRRAERPQERKSPNGNGSSNGTPGAAPKRDPAFWARLGLPIPVESEPIAQPKRDDIPF